jgi:hypothetical protein
MAERRHRVEELFHAALEMQAEERASFLSEACPSDPDLKAEVESLIRAHERPGGFLDKPALGSAATVIADSQVESRVGRRHPFLWVLWFASLIIAAVFAYAAWRLIQKGGVSAEFGWSEEQQGDDWLVYRVDPGGPAAGLLEPGDRIISLNGVPPIGVAETILAGGTTLHRRELAPGQTYEITVERAGQRRTMNVGVAAGPAALATRISYFVSSLLWCLIGLWIGASRPESAVARLAAAASVAVGAVFVTLGVFELGTFWAPLHVVVGYHFFSRFPTGAAPGGGWKAVLYLLYLFGGAEATRSVAFYVVLVTGGLSDASRFPSLQWMDFPPGLLAFAGSVLAMMAVVRRNYRRLTTERAFICRARRRKLRPSTRLSRVVSLRRWAIASTRLRSSGAS